MPFRGSPAGEVKSFQLRVTWYTDALNPSVYVVRPYAPPEVRLRAFIAYAQSVVGESATMSSEAAVLGVPAVFIATTGRGYTDDEEARYKLVRHIKDDEFDRAVEVIRETLSGSPREFGREARKRLLSEKIDVTAWMIDYFETQFTGA